jgi:hypothetical protein
LLRRILNAHSRIHCGPEIKFFRDFYGDYPKDPIRHGRFFISARALVSEAELLDVMGHAFIKLHETAAARLAKPRWADKNPENVLFLREWGSLLGDAWALVHVVRNPLDTLASIKEANFPYAIPSELPERIAFYRRYTQAGLDFGAAHPERYFRLRYEHLVADPHTALRHFMEWLGERFEPGQLEFNQYAHQRGLEDPKIGHATHIHAQSIHRWPLLLSAAEAQLIWQQTRDLWATIEPDAQEPLVIDKGLPCA